MTSQKPRAGSKNNKFQVIALADGTRTAKEIAGLLDARVEYVRAVAYRDSLLLKPEAPRSYDRALQWARWYVAKLKIQDPQRLRALREAVNEVEIPEPRRASGADHCQSMRA